MIIYSANYNKAVRTAVEVLEDYEIPQAPVNLQIIFDALSREIAVLTYHDYMKASGLSRDEVIAAFDSKMGVCFYERQTNHYLIYYNDDLSDPWNRFTLAHELGHIFLEHHLALGTDVLKRSQMSEEQYKEYENEANAFARNLLSPAPLAWDVIDAGKSQHQNAYIQDAFDITEKAANTRIGLLRRDLRDYDDAMKKSVSKIHLRIQKWCPRCKTQVPKTATYCVTCGSSKLSKFTLYKPLPHEIRMDKGGYFHQCPQCGNTEISVDAKYCRICSAPLINPCTGKSQSGKTRRRHCNRSFSFYCEVCGADTIYKTHGISIRLEDTEMKYTDGAQYDEVTKKVTMCPRCSNEEFSEDALFCRICGADLYNNCEGTEEYDAYNNEPFVMQHKNPSNARYCETCGKRTYNFIHNILPDYEAYQYKLMAEAETDAAIEAAMAVDTAVESHTKALNYDDTPFPIDEELPFN